MAANPEVPKSAAAIEFAQHAEKLSLLPSDPGNGDARATTAVEARFITPQDPIIQTRNGGRLPAVPFDEALKLNDLKEAVEREISTEHSSTDSEKENIDTPFDEVEPEKASTPTAGSDNRTSQQSTKPAAPLRNAIPPSRTHPLFPSLPMYGPPTFFRSLQCVGFRFCSFILSLTFLGTIVLGSAFTSIPLMLRHIGIRLTFGDPDARRPFHEEEKRRKTERKNAGLRWIQQRKRKNNITIDERVMDEEEFQDDKYKPTEGGKDPLICDVGYYARRVGLDIEEYNVQTEDGFIITLWHVYNPSEHVPESPARRDCRRSDLFSSRSEGRGSTNGSSESDSMHRNRKYPVLLVHGLLQSAGAYCTNDDDSLAFFLCKRYDIFTAV